MEGLRNTTEGGIGVFGNKEGLGGEKVEKSADGRTSHVRVV